MLRLDQTLRHPVRVLIDTWWNVNDVMAYTDKLEENVLIDTWWNVNL